MKRTLNCFVIGVCIYTYAMPIAYLYPVAPLDDTRVLLCFQPSPDALELYLFDLTNRNSIKVISSCYRTAAVRLLPDGSGVSFIDNGMVRIKRFATRSVKTLEIFEPLYNIDYIEWLDNTTCYFHAQSNGFCGIYSLSMDEIIKEVRVVDGIDCMYPQIVESKLFFVERVDKGANREYTIKSCKYPENTEPDVLILTVRDRQIVFLKMNSCNKGYFLEYNVIQTTVTFCYHSITYDGAWQENKLFTFDLPISLFSDSPDRFFESLLPFLPRHIDDAIYYSNITADQKLLLYAYDLRTLQLRNVATSTEFSFAPIKCGDTFVIGSSVPSGTLQGSLHSVVHQR